MKVIDQSGHCFFAELNTRFCLGYVGGPVRLIGAVVQIALNLIALIFSPLTTCCLGKKSAWRPGQAVGDIGTGLRYIFWSVYEFCPGTSFYSPVSTQKALDIATVIRQRAERGNRDGIYVVALPNDLLARMLIFKKIESYCPPRTILSATENSQLAWRVFSS